MWLRKKKLKSLIRFHSANKIYKYTEAQCGVGWGGVGERWRVGVEGGRKKEKKKDPKETIGQVETKE